MKATREVEFTIPVEPCSKSRHRAGVRGGRVYHYKDTDTRRAQDEVGVYFRQAAGPVQPAGGGFGVKMDFHVGRRQRRDVDNMVKLVLDGLTGLAWEDDSQVTEIAARIIHESDSPRSEVRVYATDDLPDHLMKTCEHCTQEFRTYASWSNRKYCDEDCRRGAVRTRNNRQCEQCSQPFQTSKGPRGGKYCSVPCKTDAQRVDAECTECGNAFRQARYLSLRYKTAFCQEDCSTNYWREHRKYQARGVCKCCGGATSKKSYEMCMGCAIEKKRAGAAAAAEVASV